MRALLTLALTMVMAAIAVDASLGLHRHPAVAQRLRRTTSGVAAVGHPLREGNNSWSNSYRRAFELGVAVVTKNYTWVDALIADDAVLLITDISCSPMTKAEFMSGVQSSDAIARYFDFGTWAGYPNDGALIHATVGAVLSPNSPLPNATVQDDKVFVFALASEDGSQLQVFERFSARAQENATAMVAAWKVLRDASALHDITPWENALSSDFQFALGAAWSTEWTLANKTTLLADMQAEWATEATRSLHEYFSYAVCDFVVADVLWSAIRTDGTAQLQRFWFSIHFNADLSVNQFSEYTVMPWL
jgi:hypothetical protein